MARENWANALLSVGEGLEKYAGQRMEREAKALDHERQQALIEMQHGLNMDMEMIRQKADMTRFAAGESAANERARDREKFESGLFEKETKFKHIESLRDAHTREQKYFEDRIRELTDKIDEEKLFEGMPGYDRAVSEVTQLQESRDRSMLDFMIRMRDYGEPGYAEAIESILRNETVGDAETEGTPVEGAPQEEAVAGMSMTPPASVTPGSFAGEVPDLRPDAGAFSSTPALQGRPSRGPGAAAPTPTVPGRGGVPATDVGSIFQDLFRMRPDQRSRGSAPARPGIEGEPQARNLQLDELIPAVPARGRSYNSRGRKPNRRARTLNA